jgi:hypothetical protein
METAFLENIMTGKTETGTTKDFRMSGGLRGSYHFSTLIKAKLSCFFIN